MIEKGPEEKKLKKTEVPELFHWRYIDQAPDHEYQLAIHRVTNTTTIESNIGTAIVDILILNQDAAFDIEDFLDHQYDCCNGEHKKFLDTLGSLIQFGLTIWTKTGIVPENFSGIRVKAWVNEKRQVLREQLAPIQMPSAIAHKVLALHELGVIDFLRKKYFSTEHTDRDYNVEARLVSAILSIEKVETVRKAISGINSTGQDKIKTKPAIQEVNSFLARFGIPSK
ncbi:MAG: hypothetical protein H7069_05910 [Phormidesmis sp. FL-bin-119]|nr:hypothetical protein [Pedobacter sp.]